MSNLNEKVSSLVGLIAKNSLLDEHWRLFGYKSRPKRGKFFRKFIDKAKLSEEDFLLKELVLLSTIDVIQAIKKQDITEEDKILYIVGVLSELFFPLSQSGLFSSDEKYFEFIKEGCDDYLKHGFIESFISRTKKSVDGNNSKKIIAHALIINGFNNERLGLILDRAMIASEILPLSGDEKLNFRLNMSKLGIYTNFANEFIKNNN